MGFQGKKIFYSYFYADSNSPWKGDTYGGVLTQQDLTVKDGIELGTTASLYSIDVSDTQIRFAFHDAGIFSGAAFNGVLFEDKYDALNPIIGVTMSTNVHGLVARDILISSDGNSFAVNFQGASFGQRSYITLSVEFELNEISGKRGNDLLKGAVSDDRIYGGRGADKLYGDAGQDIFVFRTGDSGSTRASADTIFDFSRKQGDKIDLGGWDADSTKKGMQDFDFIGKAAFSKDAGELRYETMKGDTYLYGDTDGDGKADFLIRLDPAANLKAGDFLF